MNYKHILKSSCFTLLFFCFILSGKAQTTYSAAAEFTGQFSSQDELPFWMYSNQRGRSSSETNLLGLLSGKITHQLKSGAILEAGAGGLLHNGFKKKLVLDEAYIHFQNSWFYATGGVKQREDLYNGLSASNENILWSLNARPLPGIEIGTTRPIFLIPGIGFELKWGEYIQEKDRHVPHARVHHKRFRLVLEPATNWQIKAGIQHFAQWGGVSPDRGQQPESFSDYLKIFVAKGGGEEALQGDKENSLGNHLGSWELEVNHNLSKSSVSFIYNNIFEDGSGSRFANWPDGRYGLTWKNKDATALFTGILYELYYTKHQSHDVNRWGADNYLNHLMTYNSGWSYSGQVIGSPFFIYDQKLDRIVNNKFTAHHLGISGNFGSTANLHPYRLLLSYRNNKGSYYKNIYPTNREPKIFSTYFNTRVFEGSLLSASARFSIGLQLAADFHNHESSNLGAGVSLKWVIR